MPQRVVQSVVPIGALLFIVAELLTLPDVLRGPVRYHGEDEPPERGEERT
jgi:hypothetical protein